MKTPLSIPKSTNNKALWPKLTGSAEALAIAETAKRHNAPILIIAESNLAANQLARELKFFSKLDILLFPDWETLPYDMFSPHQDITSERLHVLSQLPQLKQGIIIISISNLMQRLAPINFVLGHSLSLKVGETIHLEQLKQTLIDNAYRHVSQVIEHGEFVTRGAIIDLFPMGDDTPYRIELFDNEIDTIRSFDPETQRSIESVKKIELLPAKEFPLNQESIDLFRQQWREQFHGNPNNCPAYKAVSDGQVTAGLEYYFPLFFKETISFLDYLPEKTLIIRSQSTHEKALNFWQELEHRYDQLAHDVTRPILKPQQLFIPENDLFSKLNNYLQINIKNSEPNQLTKPLPDVAVDHKKTEPLAKLKSFLNSTSNSSLICAESAGRREALLALLHMAKIEVTLANEWQTHYSKKVNLTVAPLQQGCILNDPPINIITETELFGERALQSRHRKKTDLSQDAIIRNLAELKIGDPVIHSEHGVGRYQGLKTITVEQITDEYLVLEYAEKNTLYVPVANLNLISRYAGADAEHAPLHKLGSDQWSRAKEKAAKRVCDVAAELLDIYAKRAAKKAYQFSVPDQQYEKFAAAFPFEETPDQENAINNVIADMCSDKPMDRLICGDVGFGKTEVAMRAAFLAAIDGKQTTMLVPTTLLAQQHYENFKDRFADWPIEIEVLSRFRTATQQKNALQKLADGKIDIIVGTHRLLQKDIKFKDLGLMIIDEEHRFGVRHKEKLKAMREEVDILTLTATPIPRTLNLSLSGMRDLSLIATPPAKRLSVKTFVTERKDQQIRDAMLREIMRGGQVYFLYNNVSTIDKTAEELAKLVPEAKITIGHGQMRERELERIMSDFHHQKFNVLVSTTIIESGIDIPSANTIIIDRADKFGLAQLHQLRGRVGRSHHQAYAYLLIPSKKALTKDAEKRLDAIAALEDLGIGFTLATHDLEIRGTGELLGDEQSGHMEEIGFTLYMEMLERAVNDLKVGKTPNLKATSTKDIEINLGVSAIIPEDYLPDVHARLVLYKRIASCNSAQALDEIKVEMIDRFGTLPEAAEMLFEVSSLKLQTAPLGIKKIMLSKTHGNIEFEQKTKVDPACIIQLIQSNKNYRMMGANKLRFEFDEKEGLAYLKKALKGLKIED